MIGAMAWLSLSDLIVRTVYHGDEIVNDSESEYHLSTHCLHLSTHCLQTTDRSEVIKVLSVEAFEFL